MAGWFGSLHVNSRKSAEFKCGFKGVGGNDDDGQM